MNHKKTKKNHNIKSDFPFFNNNPQLVYLDSSATVLKPQSVINAINSYYNQYSINTHSQDYNLAVIGNNIFEDTRKIISTFINGTPNEIVFCPSATFAYNQIAFSLEQYLTAGDEILVTTLEHSSLLLPFYRLVTRKKVVIKFIETNDAGVITIANLKKVLSVKTKIVAFANINNSLAMENDTEELTKFIKTYGQTMIKTTKWPFANILVIIDGAQSISHIKTDVKKWDIDFFGFSGHKIFGPTGIGVWWGKKQWLTLLEPLLLGGGMTSNFNTNSFKLLDSPYCFEAGTPNMAGVFGLQAAIKYVMKIGITTIRTHEIALKKYAVAQLTKYCGDQIKIYNHDGTAGNLIFNIKGVSSQDVANYLGTQNICVRSGTYCAKLLPQTLNSATTVRASFFIYNDFADIDALVNTLKKGINNGGDFLNAFF